MTYEQNSCLSIHASMSSSESKLSTTDIFISASDISDIVLTRDLKLKNYSIYLVIRQQTYICRVSLKNACQAEAYVLTNRRLFGTPGAYSATVIWYIIVSKKIEMNIAC